MKRLVVLAAALLTGCASGGNTASPAGSVRSTVSISSQTVAGNTTLDSYTNVGGSTHRVSATADRVWEVLPAVYQSLGIAVGTSLPEAKTIGNTKLVLNRSLAGEPLSAFLSCGDGPMGTPLANSYRVDMAIFTIVTPLAGSGAQVETRVNAIATNRAVSGAPVSCATTGRLEGLIAERIKNHAG